jgi:hypothetical protein
VPDPGSRHQPQDVHGQRSRRSRESTMEDRSLVRASLGRKRHLRTAYRLVHLGRNVFRSNRTIWTIWQNLGVTAIQIMPVSDFPGRYNWGYDGVLPYAPDSSYGRPEDFMALVDAAHERGISVILDVVYNHFGPDGNYLPTYAPLFTEHHKTPWGNGINYDGDESKAVREFIIQNAIYWIRNSGWTVCVSTRCTPSRTTAKNIFFTSSPGAFAEAAGTRHVHLIVENEDNDSDLLRRDENGRPCASPPSGTTMCITCCTSPRPAKPSAITRTMPMMTARSAGACGRFCVSGRAHALPWRNRGKPSTDLPPNRLHLLHSKP